MRRLIVVSCLLLVAVLVAGCGERIETARYYYSPSWTKEGKIIFIGALKSVRKDVLGSRLGSTYTEYVSTIYPSGTGESPSLFEVTGAPPYAMSCSPTRDYVGYMGDLRSGWYGKIVIRNISTEAYDGMKEVELLFSSTKIKSFDWSNDGNKIVYCTTNEVWIRDWNDYAGTTATRVATASDLTFVTWKYGDRIAAVSTSEGTFLVSSTGGSKQPLVGAGIVVDKPQISSTNTNEVFGIMGGNYVKVNANTRAITNTIVSNFTGILPRLSPDATRVTYSKTGEDSGIYILYTATGTEETVKK